MTKEIFKRIEQVKAKLKLTQQALADAGNISKGTVRNIFSGSSTPNVTALHGWAQNLDIDLNWLISGEGEMLRTDDKKRLARPKIKGDIALGPITEAVAEVENALNGVDKLIVIKAAIGKLEALHQNQARQRGGYGSQLETREPSDFYADDSNYPAGAEPGNPHRDPATNKESLRQKG